MLYLIISALEVEKQRDQERIEREKREAERKTLEEAEFKKKQEAYAAQKAIAEKKFLQCKQVSEKTAVAMIQYKKLISDFHQLRLLFEENVTQNVDFDQYMDTYCKIIDSIKVISTIIHEDINKHKSILKNLQSSVDDIKNVMDDDTSKPIRTAWMEEFSEDLDEVDDRLFKLTEDYKKCVNNIEKIDKVLKLDDFKIQEKAFLNKDEEQVLAKQNKEISGYVARLSRKILDLRKQVKILNQSDAVKKTKEAIDKAGGLNDVLESSALLEDSVELSFLTAENNLTSNFTALNVNDDTGKDELDTRKREKVNKLLKQVKNRNNMTSKVVKPIILSDFLSKKGLNYSNNDDIMVVHPKVAEARKSLVENLTALKKLQKLPDFEASFVDNFVSQTLKGKHLFITIQ